MTTKRYYTTAIAYTAAGGLDEQLARQIARYLKEAGVDVFIQDDRAGGRFYRMTREILSRERMIVIVSSASLGDERWRGMVIRKSQQEFREGAGEYIIPVMLDGALIAHGLADPERLDDVSTLCDRGALSVEEPGCLSQRDLGRLLRALQQ